MVRTNAPTGRRRFAFCCLLSGGVVASSCARGASNRACNVVPVVWLSGRQYDVVQVRDLDALPTYAGFVMIGCLSATYLLRVRCWPAGYDCRFEASECLSYCAASRAIGPSGLCAARVRVSRGRSVTAPSASVAVRLCRAVERVLKRIRFDVAAALFAVGHIVRRRSRSALHRRRDHGPARTFRSAFGGAFRAGFGRVA